MDELSRYLNYSHTVYDPEWTELTIDNEIKPIDYLEFAREDISTSDYVRDKVNAYSNTKRALHFQIDLLINAFGVNSPNNMSFPRKLELCEKCGIGTPRILEKVNFLRNKIEHDYLVPKTAEVEDAIDVIELFLSSTDRFFCRFPDNIIFPDIDATIFGYTGIINVKLIKNKGEIVLTIKDEEDNYSEKNYITPSEEFFAWLYFINHCTK
ncbi:hypothetical protein KO519_06300 [Paraglaciecola agarilytica]|uniref:hypothetical protein n=1 Tax=Paraglaciecola chathamensis TaxID=368405 RepID=UPI001C09782B|nr:hypothetical protein [Paraglaciecola agarilytica]MBU3017308.1 hypothetical protein [Paraglaciecola agarilytica]